MPQLVVASPRTTPSIVPPASAFQSPIRILKRSTAPTPTHHQRNGGGDAGDSSSPSSPSSSATPLVGAGTFAERSARYNAARERIFAAEASATNSAGTSSTSTGTSTSTGDPGTTGSAGASAGTGAVSAIIRNPKGPEPVQGPNGQGRGGSQGFGARTGKRGSSGHRPNDEKQGRQ